MSATYLLLRNNKQTGPFSLEALLQHNLQPHDLIWMEGQSAGWSYPSEINSLKSYINSQIPATAAPLSDSTTQEKPAQQSRPAFKEATQPDKKALHIYVALPAGMPPRVETEPAIADSLEAKATALHERIQAFAAGGAKPDDTETPYARSLDDMKQAYGAWRIKQEGRKKFSTTKRNLVIAASLLVVTTSGVGIGNWMRSKPLLVQPDVELASDPVLRATPKQTATVSFHPAADSFTTTVSSAVSLQKDSVTNDTLLVKTGANRAAAVKKKSTPEIKKALPAPDTTHLIVVAPPPEVKPTVPEEVKKVLPLSRLVVVNGILQHNNRGNNTATQVTLQNNSAETLKSVAISITYFRKEDRQLGKEMVYFYNVQPATTPVIQIDGNRRATSARFEIGNITRADGSLYIIH